MVQDSWASADGLRVLDEAEANHFAQSESEGGVCDVSAECIQKEFRSGSAFRTGEHLVPNLLKFFLKSCLSFFPDCLSFLRKSIISCKYWRENAIFCALRAVIVKTLG